MNDDSLKTVLRKLEVPPPDATASERALHRALIAYRNHEAPEPVPSKEQPWRVWAGGALVLGCLAAALLLSDRSEHPSPLAFQRELLRQMETLFPGQLDAIVEHGDELRVITNSQPESMSDQPLLVTFQSPGRTIRVLSYSGNEVCVKIAGREVCFEMLMTDDGKVILSGRDFLWSDEHPQRVAGCQVQAASLAHL